MSRRPVLLLLCAFLSVLGVTGCGADPGAPVVAYAGDPSSRTVTLTVEVGPSDVVGAAAVTDQTDTELRVRVDVERSDNQPGLAVRKQVTVNLDRALGSRRVLDQAGSPVPSAAPSPPAAS